jgi:hypothetical protein
MMPRVIKTSAKVKAACFFVDSFSLSRGERVEFLNDPELDSGEFRNSGEGAVPPVAAKVKRLPENIEILRALN